MKYNFIIPYRNRNAHLQEFIKRFTGYLEGKDIDAHFYVIHQITPGAFNRGAMKNIGFLEACKTRPDGLFIFHDVDTYPTAWGSIPYDAKPGTFRRPVLNSSPNNLGLICSCWKTEYERVNGFPNYTGWGAEDGVLYHRAMKLGVPIDEHSAVHYQDRTVVINREHPRNNQYQDMIINADKLSQEKQTGDSTNGLSSLRYEVICSIELAPRFTMINVDFTTS